MCKNVIKKSLFLIKHDPDRIKTHAMCDKAILENGATLMFVPDW